MTSYLRTRSFYPKFLNPKFVELKNFEPHIFLDPNFFWPKFLWTLIFGPKLVWTKLFFYPKFRPPPFLNNVQNFVFFFMTSLGPNFFFNNFENYFRTINIQKNFGQKDIFGPRRFLIQKIFQKKKFVWKKVFGPNKFLARKKCSFQEPSLTHANLYGVQSTFVLVTFVHIRII